MTSLDFPRSDYAHECVHRAVGFPHVNFTCAADHIMSTSTPLRNGSGSLKTSHIILYNYQFVVVWSCCGLACHRSRLSLLIKFQYGVLKQLEPYTSTIAGLSSSSKVQYFTGIHLALSAAHRAQVDSVCMKDKLDMHERDGLFFGISTHWRIVWVKELKQLGLTDDLLHLNSTSTGDYPIFTAKSTAR